MSLNCDCYPGCWGDHSKDWPKTTEHAEAKKIFMAMASNLRKHVEYGDAVMADGELRIANEAGLKKLEECFGIAAKAIMESFAASLPKPEARPEREGLRAALEQAIAVYKIGRDLSWRLQGFEGVCTDKEAPWVIQARAALRSPGAGAE